MEIKYVKQNKDLPDFTKLEDEAGYMVRIGERRLIRPFDIQQVRTGISLKVPKGYELEILTMNRIIKETGIGVLSGIESYPPGYEGEITVHLKNFKPTMQMLDIAMPIARMVLRKVEDVSFVSSDETFIKKENKDNSKEDENENTNKNDTPGSDNPEKSKSD